MDEFFEKLKIPFCIQTLKNEFLENTLNLPPTMLSQHFGGWSITSSSGDIADGWLKATPFINSKEQNIDQLRHYNNSIGFKGPQAYREPTRLCTGEAKNILDYLNEQSFFPCRARFTILKPGGGTRFHQDYPDWLYGVRLHIPIITNENSFFEYEGGFKKNLKADGTAYLLKINKTHRVFNNGTEDRVHFLCDFFDLNHKTVYNKYFKAQSENQENLRISE